MTHGVVVLCQLSYIRKFASRTVGLIQVPEVVSQQVVKERPPPPIGVGGAIHRSLVCANARTG
jgi:hypothetical protein